MDMSEVKAFNAELSGLYENKPPISKAKMNAITRGAIKAIKFYKHVVHSVEKFIQKCKPEYKVPGLYVIDSIVRQSRHQFGQDKDVFAPRFAKNMQQTFANLFRCPPEDKRNIIRVLNLWQKNRVFSPEVIQPLLDMADPNHPLHTEIQQQNNAANASNVIAGQAVEKSPAMQQQHTPRGATPNTDQYAESQPSSAVKFNKRLLNDFEYESEDEPAPPPVPPAQPPAHPANNLGHPAQHPPSALPQTAQLAPHHTAEALGSILTNPEIMRQLQSLQAQMQLMTGLQIPNLMPMISDMQLQQPPAAPFMPEQKGNETNKDEVAQESDIEFVEAGPQIIEIPDANDSRSPSPASRRRRSRSPRRRRRSRSRSRSPRRRRDRDRDRERDKEKEREREKSNKEREAEREKQREREKKGLPPIRKEHLTVCSTTLWVGHLSKLARAEELWDLFGAVGGVASVDIVPPRGCAYVVMDRRRDAAAAVLKLNAHRLHTKEITVAWAPGKGMKEREWREWWERDVGASYVPWAAVRARWRAGALSLDALEDGGRIDDDTLPDWLPPRQMMPKMLDSMNIMPGMPPSLPGMPPVSMALPMGTLPVPTGTMPMPGTGLAIPGTGMPMPGANIPANMPPVSMPLTMPRMPPPGIAAGIPGLTPGMPPGIRPPSIPTGVQGIQSDAGLPPAGPLLGFPPRLPQPGVMGGFLSSVLLPGGVALRLPHPPQHAMHLLDTPVAEVTHTDDAMDLDTEDNTDEASAIENTAEKLPEQNATPQILPDQLQAFLSQPPPNFNATEPPPEFNAAEPPPAAAVSFDATQPPPAEEKQTEKRSERDRERSRSEKDRDRDRDRRDRDRRDRDRDSRRERDRGGRDRDREGREKESRDKDDRRERGPHRRDKERDRDRGDRERDRDRHTSRDASGRDRHKEKSPRPFEQGNEKSLQERLWEMANGKLNKGDTDNDRDNRSDNRLVENIQGDSRTGENRHDGTEEGVNVNEEMGRSKSHMDRQDNMQEMDMDSAEEKTADGGGWSQLPPPVHPATPLSPFRAELRMRGPSRPPIRGPPWMEGGPPPFGPRFNGMGPPFNRPPFDMPPMFDGPSRFDHPFNRMPFDPSARMPFDPNRKFDGPRMPFDGPRPPFDGPRPPFDGSRPPFDGPRPPFDGPRPPFDLMRPPFDGPMPPFDGPMPPFDGPMPPFDNHRPQFDGSEPQFEGRRPPFEHGRPPFDNMRHNFDEERAYDRHFEHNQQENDEYSDAKNRGFEEREQKNERGWNGERQRDRSERDRRSERDDNKRDRRSRDSEDRFRDRNDRRRNFDERSRPPRDDRHSRRDDKNPRKSRWGAPDDSEDSNKEYYQPKQVIEENQINESDKEIKESSHCDIAQETCDLNEYSNKVKALNESVTTDQRDYEIGISEAHESEIDRNSPDSNKDLQDNVNSNLFDAHKLAENETKPVSHTANKPSLYDDNDAVDTNFAPDILPTELPGAEKSTNPSIDDPNLAISSDIMESVPIEKKNDEPATP